MNLNKMYVNKIVLILTWIMDAILFLTSAAYAAMFGQISMVIQVIPVLILGNAVLIIPYKKNKASDSIKYFAMGRHLAINLICMLAGTSAVGFVSIVTVALLFLLYFDQKLINILAAGIVMCNFIWLAVVVLVQKLPLNMDMPSQVIMMICVSLTLVVVSKVNIRFNQEKIEHIKVQLDKQQETHEKVMDIKSKLDIDMNNVRTIVEDYIVFSEKTIHLTNDIIQDVGTNNGLILEQEKNTGIIKGIVDENAKLMKEIQELSITSSHEISQGTDQMAVLNEIIGSVTECGDQMDRYIQAVYTQSQKITDINDIIKNIADQTNLLALNASIEAARAGEAGKGFSVVAEEIRKLSNEISDSVEDCNHILQNISKDNERLLNQSVVLREINSSQEKAVLDTSESFEKIKETNNSLSSHIAGVKRHTDKIVEQTGSIENKMIHLTETSKNTLSTAENVSVLSSQAIEMTDKTKETVSNMIETAEKLNEVLN